MAGTICLREGGREGGGDGSLLAVTLDDTRLFLSGLDVGWKERINKKTDLHKARASNEMSRVLPGCCAACWRFTPPPPAFHCMPCLSVRGVSRLSVGALPGHFICQTMDGLVVGQDGADVLLKQSREPQTHAVDLVNK